MPSINFIDGTSLRIAEGSELEFISDRDDWFRERVTLSAVRSAEGFLANPGRVSIYRRCLGTGLWLISRTGDAAAEGNFEALIAADPPEGMALAHAEAMFKWMGFGEGGGR